MSAPPGLPSAENQAPACGACGGETSFEDDYFACYDCCLAFTADDHMTASYLDESSEPCGDPCSNVWHEQHNIKPGLTFTCSPCVLPREHETHPLSHYRPCVPHTEEKS